MVSKTSKCVAAAVVAAILLVATYEAGRSSSAARLPRRMLQASGGRTITIPWSIQPYEPMTIQVGDTVTFQWSSNHGVSLTPTASCPPSFSDSNVTPLARPSAGGSYSATATAPGTFYYACPVNSGGHCAAGQRITINVVAAGGATGGGAAAAVPRAATTAVAPAPGPSSGLPLAPNSAPIAAAAPALPTRTPSPPQTGY